MPRFRPLLKAPDCVITYSESMQEHAKIVLYFSYSPPFSKDTVYGSSTLMTSLSASYLQGQHLQIPEANEIGN